LSINKCNCYSKYNIVVFITLNLIYKKKGKDQKINEYNSDIHSSEPYRVTVPFSRSWKSPATL